MRGGFLFLFLFFPCWAVLLYHAGHRVECSATNRLHKAKGQFFLKSYNFVLIALARRILLLFSPCLFVFRVTWNSSSLGEIRCGVAGEAERRPREALPRGVTSYVAERLASGPSDYSSQRQWQVCLPTSDQCKCSCFRLLLCSSAAGCCKSIVHKVPSSATTAGRPRACRDACPAGSVGGLQRSSTASTASRWRERDRPLLKRRQATKKKEKRNNAHSHNPPPPPSHWPVATTPRLSACGPPARQPG